MARIDKTVDREKLRVSSINIRSDREAQTLHANIVAALEHAGFHPGIHYKEIEVNKRGSFSGPISIGAELQLVLKGVPVEGGVAAWRDPKNPTHQAFYAVLRTVLPREDGWWLTAVGGDQEGCSMHWDRIINDRGAEEFGPF